jgi:hypothetical protein
MNAEDSLKYEKEQIIAKEEKSEYQTEKKKDVDLL